ncbi:alpha/beta hydrolase [Novipirellula herctigrandis]
MTTTSLFAEGVCLDTSIEAHDCAIETTLNDRLWLINTRSIPTCACRVNLDDPDLKVSRLGCNGSTCQSTKEEYLSELGSDRPVVVYVHGYRFKHCEAIERGLFVYQKTLRRRAGCGPIDWVIWSWPSDCDSFITKDVREKAKFADAQALYLSWLIREQLRRSVATKLIGYSLGGRVITGSLHALAGGRLGGRTLPGETIQHAGVDVGLVAPAIEEDWLAAGQYHGKAISNMENFTVLFNQRDAVLKRYWLLDKVRGAVALGLGRMQSIVPTVDNQAIQLRALDFSRAIGITHDELDYYQSRFDAGKEMARLISDVQMVSR